MHRMHHSYLSLTLNLPGQKIDYWRFVSWITPRSRMTCYSFTSGFRWLQKRGSSRTRAMSSDGNRIAILFLGVLEWAPFWKELFLYTCGTDDGSVIIAPWKQIHEDFYQRPSSKLFVSDRWSTHMLTPVILTICPSSSRQKGTVALVDLKKRGPRFILALLNRKHQIFMCHILSFTDQHPRLSEADTENWGASTK